MDNEFEGKRYTTIVHMRDVTNVVTGEKTKYGNVYGVYDNEKDCELSLPGFYPLCYNDVREKAIELNNKINS